MNEAELLFTNILNCNRLSLYLNKDTLLDNLKSSFICGVLKRRIKGEPIQYILDKTEFMGLEFKVTPDVFIPRPETEILVEKAIEIAGSSQAGVRSILDIGTGSGCIAVSLAKFLPESKIIASDISEPALQVARENAKLNNIESKIDFISSDLFCSKLLAPESYNYIVSNPPYVPTAEIETLQPEIQYEPRAALDGGNDGLDFYRRIIDKAPRYLKKSGFLIMEMGFNQKDAIKNIFQNSLCFEIIESIKDYNNIDRVIVAIKRESANG